MKDRLARIARGVLISEILIAGGMLHETSPPVNAQAIESHIHSTDLSVVNTFLQGRPASLYAPVIVEAASTTKLENPHINLLDVMLIIIMSESGGGSHPDAVWSWAGLPKDFRNNRADDFRYLADVLSGKYYSIYKTAATEKELVQIFNSGRKNDWNDGRYEGWFNLHKSTLTHIRQLQPQVEVAGTVVEETTESPEEVVVFYPRESFPIIEPT